MRTLGPLRSGSHRQRETPRASTRLKGNQLCHYFFCFVSLSSSNTRIQYSIGIIDTSVRIQREKWKSYSASRHKRTCFSFRVLTLFHNEKVLGLQLAAEMKASRFLMESSNLLADGSFHYINFLVGGRILEEALEPTILRESWED